MKMIWATRGKHWGFRFLRDGGFPDPLPEYEKAFGEYSSETELWVKSPERIALRFGDPLQRKDSAGRLITHDFVIYGQDSDFFDSFETTQRMVWSDASQEYARVWDLNS